MVLSLVGLSAADKFARAIVYALLAAKNVGEVICHHDKYPEAYSTS